MEKGGLSWGGTYLRIKVIWLTAFVFFVIVLYGLGYEVQTRVVHETLYTGGIVHADIVHPTMATEQVYRFLNTMATHIIIWQLVYKHGYMLMCILLYICV